MSTASAAFYAAACVVVFAGPFMHKSSVNADGIYETINVGYGHELTAEDFFDEVPEDVVFTPALSEIDTDCVTEADVEFSVDDKSYTCHVNVVDLVSPAATAVPQEFYLVGEVPAAEATVTDIEDLSEVTVEYKDGVPEFEFGGEYDIDVLLTDTYGNTSVVSVPFTVKDDHLAPVIYGAKNKTVRIGETVSYREGVTVKDDFDPNPKLTVDNSKVDTDIAGMYPVVYRAEDECGNSTEVTVYVEVVIGTGAGITDEDDAEDIERAYELARQVVSKITDEDDTDVEKAMAIFYWAWRNLSYAREHKQFDSWADAAADALSRRVASCYGTWASCKAMLDVCGIQNICIRRYPQYGRAHFWCLVYLNGGWYHCDAQKWTGSGSFAFMMTDSEIKRFSGNHRFDDELYPERATESVQRYVTSYRNYVSRNFPYKDETD